MTQADDLTYYHVVFETDAGVHVQEVGLMGVFHPARVIHCAWERSERAGFHATLARAVAVIEGGVAKYRGNLKIPDHRFEKVADADPGDLDHPPTDAEYVCWYCFIVARGEAYGEGG